MYRNALIQELSDIFKYTDFDEFKRRVIKSIENEEVIVVERTHVKALYQMTLVQSNLEALNHLKSFEFRERLIVDYINVLKDHKELLEIRKSKFITNFPEVAEISQQKVKNKQNNKTNSNLFKLKDLISEISFDHLIDLIDSKERITDELTQLVQSYNNYIEIINFKLKNGHELQTLLETKLR
jgi:hypothetical protein